MFNDYLNIAILNNLYLYKITYENQDNTNDDYAQIYKDSLYISAFTDLTKEYSSFFHNINIEAGYSKLAKYEKSGYFDNEFIALSEDKDIINLRFSEYFLKEGKRFITHRANQSFYVNEDDSNLSEPDFEHEIIYSNGALQLSNTLHYSHKYKNISKSLSSAGIFYDKYGFSISNAFTKEAKEVTGDYYQYQAYAKFYKRHKVLANYSKDALHNAVRGYGVGYFYKKKCWDFYIKYSRIIKPYLSDGNVNSKINDIIYVQINLNPLWGFKQQLYEEER